ncbi:MAG TPA: hypothetical protein DCQ64_15930 [Candidatus Rokubacteria bacterium]|nr:hypothetical protein [Candidatus Rokubacteria bacterium]
MAAAAREYPTLISIKRWRLVGLDAADVYAGWYMCFKATTAYIQEASDVASSRFAGVQMVTTLNASGSAAGVNTLICVEGASIGTGDATLAGVPTGGGDVCYASDGQTVLSSGNNKVGRVLEFQNVQDPLARTTPVIFSFGVESLV